MTSALCMLHSPLHVRARQGMVLRADLAQRRLRCSYAVDVGSVNKDHVHGCDGESFGKDRTRVMMLEQDRRMRPWGPRKCQPKQVGGRNPTCGSANFGYNELILDNTMSHPWSADVPDIVQAVFVQYRSGASMVEYARRFQRDFNAEYGLDVPLLQYNWEHGTAPFTLFE